MKVRWTRESLRLRITPTEFQSLLGGDVVCESFEFAGKTVWKITVARTENQTSLTADSGVATIAVSEADLRRLSAPDQEGIYFAAESRSRPALRYYIEKDFPCVHPGREEAAEPPTETFSRP